VLTMSEKLFSTNDMVDTKLSYLDVQLRREMAERLPESCYFRC
jgi:hypothetical protein